MRNTNIFQGSDAKTNKYGMFYKKNITPAGVNRRTSFSGASRRDGHYRLKILRHQKSSL